MYFRPRYMDLKQLSRILEKNGQESNISYEL